MRSGRVLAALLAGTAALVPTECVLRRVVPAGPFYSTWSPGWRTVNHPDTAILPGVHATARVTINSLGVRGEEISGQEASEYRVLVLGSSTSEMVYLDDDSTWTHLVQSGLGRTPDGRRVWVGTTGRTRNSTRDNAVQLMYLLREYPRMHAVLELGGINDLTTALLPTVYQLPRPVTDPVAERAQLPLAFSEVVGWGPDVPNRGAAWKRVIQHSATFELLRRGWHGVLTLAARMGFNGDDHMHNRIRLRANRARAIRLLDTLPDLAAPLIEYRANLERIVDVACTRGVRPLLVTNPALWRANLTQYEQSLLFLGGTGPIDSRNRRLYYSVRALAEALDQFNDVVLDVCRSRGVECIDLAPAIPRDTTVFIDDSHFNVHGAKQVASVITRYLQAHWDKAMPGCHPPLTSAMGRSAQPAGPAQSHRTSNFAARVAVSPRRNQEDG